MQGAFFMIHSPHSLHWILGYSFLSLMDPSMNTILLLITEPKRDPATVHNGLSLQFSDKTSPVLSKASQDDRGSGTPSHPCSL